MQMQELFQVWLKLNDYLRQQKVTFDFTEPVDLNKVGEVFAEFKEIEATIFSDLWSTFERTLKVWQLRIAFAEKLILLNTGTFALSLTFLGSFGQHTAARQAFHNIWFLYSAWACLFLSISAAAWHNQLIIAASDRLAALPGIFSDQQKGIK
jgi:hypothetical protein